MTLLRYLFAGIIGTILWGGMTRLGIEHHWYDSSISNSPLTDRDSGLSVFLSWSKFF
jgi:outer membrane protein